VTASAMTELMMLDLDAIDLEMLCVALEDHSTDELGSSWWVDPRNGEVRFHNPDIDDDTADDLDDSGFIAVEPTSSSQGYSDMEDFIDAVPHHQASRELARAIGGRGAFRRFKDVLFDYPELREQWFAFHDARLRRRAIEWVRDHGLVDEVAATAGLEAWPDPPLGGELELPRAIAADLHELYGDRLVDVFVFGSRARGDAATESDLDLLVVLDHVDDPWAEHERMDETLWRHTLASGVVVTAFPVAKDRYDHPDVPVLIRAKAEASRAA
jgi:predicted nucleotidyltransferase